MIVGNEGMGSRNGTGKLAKKARGHFAIWLVAPPARLIPSHALSLLTTSSLRMLSAARVARLSAKARPKVSRRGYVAGPQKNPYDSIRKSLKVGGQEFSYYDLKELKDKRLSTSDIPC